MSSIIYGAKLGYIDFIDLLDSLQWGHFRESPEELCRIFRVVVTSSYSRRGSQPRTQLFFHWSFLCLTAIMHKVTMCWKRKGEGMLQKWPGGLLW